MSSNPSLAKKFDRYAIIGFALTKGEEQSSLAISNAMPEPNFGLSFGSRTRLEFEASSRTIVNLEI